MTAVRRNLTLVLAAVLLVIGLLGWWMFVDLRSAASSDNAAIVDTKTTAEVQASVSQSLTRVLTYDHADPKATSSAADAVLAGAARKEYDTLFASLQERAPGQKLMLTAQVQVAAVKHLEGDSAKLLVFLDQSSRRAGDKEASVSAAQIAVSAKKAGGTWKVTSLKPL